MNLQAQYRKGCLRTLVLKLLSEQPMYGYQLTKELAARSNGIFTVSQGTLYPMLYSMERKNLIAIAGQETYGQKSRRRVYYQSTASGRKALVQEMETWSQITRGMSLVLENSNTGNGTNVKNSSHTDSRP